MHIYNTYMHTWLAQSTAPFEGSAAHTAIGHRQLYMLMMDYHTTQHNGWNSEED